MVPGGPWPLPCPSIYETYVLVRLDGGCAIRKGVCCCPLACNLDFERHARGAKGMWVALRREPILFTNRFFNLL